MGLKGSSVEYKEAPKTPASPTLEDESVKEASENERRKIRANYGRNRTLFGSVFGLSDGNSQQNRTQGL